MDERLFSGLPTGIAEALIAQNQTYMQQRQQAVDNKPVDPNLLKKVGLTVLYGIGAPSAYRRGQQQAYEDRISKIDDRQQELVKTLGQFINNTNSTRESFGNQQAVEQNFSGLTGNTGALSSQLAQELLRGGSANESLPLINQAASTGLNTGASAGNSQLANLLGQIGGGKVLQVKTVTTPMKREVTQPAPEQLNAGGFTNQEVGKTTDSFGLDLSQPEATATPQAGTLNAGVKAAQRPQAGYFSPETYNTLAQLLGGTTKTAYSEAPNYAKTPSEIAKSKAQAAYDQAGVALRGAQTRQTNEETRFIAPQARANIAQSYASAGASNASAASSRANAAQTYQQMSEAKQLQPLIMQQKLAELKETTKGAYKKDLERVSEQQKIASDNLLRIGALNKKTGTVNFSFKSKDKSVQKVFNDSTKALGNASRELKAIDVQAETARWLEQLGGK